MSRSSKGKGGVNYFVVTTQEEHLDTKEQRGQQYRISDSHAADKEGAKARANSLALKKRWRVTRYVRVTAVRGAKPSVLDVEQALRDAIADNFSGASYTDDEIFAVAERVHKLFRN